MGIALADWMWPPACLAIGVLCICLAMLSSRIGPLRARRPLARGLGLLAMMAVAAAIGAGRMQEASAELAAGSAYVQRYTGTQQIRGLVADDPVPRRRTTSLTLSDVLVRNGDSWEPLGARLLVNVPHRPEHDYGEYLQLRGRLQPLAGGGAVEALGRQGVLGSMSYPRVSYLANPQANRALIAISRLRQRLGETIDQTLPEPEASTLKATILGLRSALPKDEQQALVNTGTVHLIVISGFKLSLLAAALQLLAGWILRRTTAHLWARAGVSAAVLGTIAGYTVLTGATPSAVRAAIMAGLVVLAALVGRPQDQLAALAIAVAAIAGARPAELMDGGFQLSCLSVLGIVLLAKPLAGWFRRPVARLSDASLAARLVRIAGFALAEAMAASLAATLFDIPVLAASFRIVSLVSPLANLLGMPVLWPVMVFGCLGALLGNLWAPLGVLLLWPAWAFTLLLELIVHGSAGLPYAALAIDGMEPAAMAVYYTLLLGGSWWLRRQAGTDSSPRPASSKRPAWGLMAPAALGIAAVAVVQTTPPGGVRTTLLAVPGQAALVQTPTGVNVLIDGGQSGPDVLRQLGQLLPPWQRSLQLVLITSARTDHIGGLGEVFSRYTIGGVIEPDGAVPNATLRRLEAGSQRLEAEVIELGDGAVLRRMPEGWRLEQGASSVLFREQGFDVEAPDGSWRVLPIGRTSGGDGEALLSLAETGNLTISFGR